MLKTLIAAAGAAVILTASAQADMIRKESANDVATTADKLEAAVKEKGAAVVARVNHQAAAAKNDLEMPAAQLLIFGNPKLGTPIMNAAITAALDLPLRVAVIEDADGKVWLIYGDPQDFAAAHGIPADLKPIGMMTKVLDDVTTQAASAN